MVKKRIAILHNGYSEGIKNGHSLRVDTLKKLFDPLKFDVFLSNDVHDFTGNWDLSIVVSPKKLGGVRHFVNSSKIIWFDSIDSIVRTRLLGLGRLKISSYLLGIIEITQFLWFKRHFGLITYITKNDSDNDSAIRKKIPYFVIPNNNPIPKVHVDQYTRIKRAVFVGEFKYNSNRKAVKWLCQQNTKGPLEIPIHVYGKYSDKLNLTKRKMRKANLVLHGEGSEQEIYRSGDLHLIPIWNDVGLKNKVINPVNLGIPVVVGVESAIGLKPNNLINKCSKVGFINTVKRLIAEEGKYGILDNQLVEFIDDDTSQLLRTIGL